MQILQTAQIVQSKLLPKHIAIIMDGNGRWAKQRFLPRTDGHKHALAAVRATIEFCVENKIASTTLFGFGMENWKRPTLEIEAIMSLFASTLKNELSTLVKNNIKLLVIGDNSKLSKKLQEEINFVENATKNNTGLNLNLAISYSGKWDIVNAAKKIALDVKNNIINIDEIDEQFFSKYLSLANQSDPDLLIRSSGEKRISNFLIWQLAYTELYFTDVLWPDFSKEELAKALNFYSLRQRRFGTVDE